MDETDTTIDQSNANLPRRTRTGRAFLTLMSSADGSSGSSHLIELGKTLIGRDPEADVQIEGQDISRRHARIISDRDRTAKILDLESRNGTFVNGTPVTIEVLRDGDRIRIGKTTVFAFRYEYERAPVDAAAEAADLDPRVDVTTADGGKATGSADGRGETHHERALEHYERTLKMRMDRVGSSHPSVAETLDRIGEVNRAQGNLAAAIERHERALGILDGQPGGAPLQAADTLRNLGECHLALGNHDEAIAALRRSVDLMVQRDGSQVELAWPRFALARALEAAGRDADQARTLAREAREGFAAGTADARMMAAQVDEWLASAS